jgi:DNA-binding response OmpR family regulator
MIPIVVLTGRDDEDLALACIDAGAQDFLPKSEIHAQNLKRAIGYAATRIREMQLHELQETLGRYRALSSSTMTTSVTADLAGSGAVSMRKPDVFEAAVAAYFGLLEPYLLREADRIRAPRTDMECIITALGDAGAGPRDLVDVHVTALDRALALYDDPHSRTVVFEARLLALEMMGLLVDFYRVGHRRLFARGNP